MYLQHSSPYVKMCANYVMMSVMVAAAVVVPTIAGQTQADLRNFLI